MQPLWAVSFDSRCERNGRLIPIHEIIIDAPTSGEAKQQAEQWFREQNPCTSVPGKIRFLGVKMLSHLRVYNHAEFKTVEYDVAPISMMEKTSR